MGAPGRRGVKRDLVYGASAETPPGRRFAPPKAGFFYPVAVLHSLSDAKHRIAERAVPRGKITPVKRFN